MWFVGSFRALLSIIVESWRHVRVAWKQEGVRRGSEDAALFGKAADLAKADLIAGGGRAVWGGCGRLKFTKEGISPLRSAALHFGREDGRF